MTLIFLYRENDFENGNHYYRFLEHEPFVMGCFNFRSSTNDNEPKPASFMADRLSKLMFSIVEMDGYVSDDGLHVDYFRISKSEEFRRYFYQLTILSYNHIYSFFNLISRAKIQLIYLHDNRLYETVIPLLIKNKNDMKS